MMTGINWYLNGVLSLCCVSGSPQVVTSQFLMLKLQLLLLLFQLLLQFHQLWPQLLLLLLMDQLKLIQLLPALQLLQLLLVSLDLSLFLNVSPKHSFMVLLLHLVGFLNERKWLGV